MTFYRLDDIKDEIEKIGNDLFTCVHGCSDIIYEPQNGIPPRCLFFQDWDSDNEAEGCAVVGLNPGKLDEDASEKEYYLRNGANYKNVLGFFKHNIAENKNGYYYKLNKFVRQYGIMGPILWTEVVHCECRVKRQLSLKTQITCSRTFLTRELALLPKNWTIFAVGREAYQALIFKYNDFKIVGVPHATGAWAKFNKFFSHGTLKAHIRKKTLRI